MSRLVSRTLMVFWCLLAIAGTLHAQPRYTLTDLGAFQPVAIAGPWVVGHENGRPVRLNLNTGQKVVLPDDGFGPSLVSDVNGTGWAIGTTKQQTAAGQIVNSATFWRPDGSFARLPGDLPSYGNSINNRLTMAGTSGETVQFFGFAMRWWADGRVERFPEQLRGYPVIDGHDHVWIEFRIPDNATFIWLADGSLSERIPVPDQTTFMDASEGGSMVASERDLHRGLVFPPDAPMIVLPKPNPTGICQANGGNDALETVGFCAFAGQGFRAVLWPAAGGVMALDTLANLPTGTLTSAEGINDDGQIVGTTAGGRGFLLTPFVVPLAQCGGDVPCQCGDTVVRDYTFTAPLGPCEMPEDAPALVIDSGVTVNGNGQVLSGTGSGVGVLFDGAQGADVGSLHVTGFGVGVKFQGGARTNRYHDSWVWGHAQNGLWFEAGVQENVVVGVNALLNGEYGVVLTLAERNTVAYVTAWSNGTSLALHATDRNTFWTNTWYGDRGDAALLNDSHGNGFYFDTFACAPGHGIVLHNSADTDFHQVRIGCPVRREPAVASQEAWRHSAD